MQKKISEKKLERKNVNHRSIRRPTTTENKGISYENVFLKIKMYAFVNEHLQT